jgi:membrane protein implicated in regulation of membrane protease activity
VSGTERASSFGGSRWSVLAVLALAGVLVSAIGGMWLEAALFLAAAVVLAVVAQRAARR